MLSVLWMSFTVLCCEACALLEFCSLAHCLSSTSDATQWCGKLSKFFTTLWAGIECADFLRAGSALEGCCACSIPCPNCASSRRILDAPPFPQHSPKSRRVQKGTDSRTGCTVSGAAYLCRLWDWGTWRGKGLGGSVAVPGWELH